MLNKNDPLIGAVQEVMKRNQAEREAAKIVNEAFGVEDRKALPHELQGQWDAAYKTVLTEGVEALDEAKLSPEHKSVITQKLQKIHGKGKVKFGPNGATWSDGIDQRTHDVTVNKSGKVKMDSSPYLESQLEEEEALDEKLVGNQPNIDVASSTGEKKPDGKLTKHDFEHLRAMKEEEQIDEAGMMPTGIKRVLGRLKAGHLANKYNDRALGDDPYQRTPPENYKKDIGQAIKYRRIEKRLKGKEKTLEEKAPPGREDQVKALKKKFPKGSGSPWAIAWSSYKKAMKEDNEGFNNRHGLSVTASAEKQAVADQLNERLVDTRQRTSRLAPIHTQGIKQTKARLAREPAEPAKSFTQRAAEVGRGVEAGARGFASGLTDLGQTSLGYKPLSDYALDAITPGRGERLAKEFPRAKSVGQGFGDLAGYVAGPEALIAKGITKVPKLASNIYRGLRSTEKGAEVATTAPKLLSAPNKATTVSQAAREPTAVDKFIAKAKATPVTPAAREGGTTATAAGTQAAANAAKYNKSGTVGGRFSDRLAQARRNAGSDPKARQLPALRGTTQPTNYVRPGLPAVRPAPSTTLTRPGMPNLGAGGATRIVGLSNKAKAGLAAGVGAVGVGTATYIANKPGTDAKAQGAKVGTSAISKPSGSTAQPYGMNIPKKLSPDSRIAKGNVTPSTAPAPATTTTTGAPPKAAAPQAQRPQPQANQPSATERRENRRLLDKGLVVGPEAKRAQQRSGTGVTIQQKAATQVNRPVGTGRVK